MMKEFFVPISKNDYERFQRGITIGIRKHKSRPIELIPLFQTERDAVHAYKRCLNSLKNYEPEFMVLKFRIPSKHKNVVLKNSRLYWDSSLSKKFFAYATEYSKRRGLVDILWTLVKCGIR